MLGFGVQSRARHLETAKTKMSSYTTPYQYHKAAELETPAMCSIPVDMYINYYYLRAVEH